MTDAAGKRPPRQPASASRLRAERRLSPQPRRAMATTAEEAAEQPSPAGRGEDAPVRRQRLDWPCMTRRPRRRQHPRPIAQVLGWWSELWMRFRREKVCSAPTSHSWRFIGRAGGRRGADEFSTTRAAPSRTGASRLLRASRRGARLRNLAAASGSKGVCLRYAASRRRPTSPSPPTIARRRQRTGALEADETREGWAVIAALPGAEVGLAV